MLHRILVFLLSVSIAVAIGFIVRQGELDASAALERWPGTTELKAQDNFIRARPEFSPRSDIVIVAADDASVKRYGKLPFDRAVWSRALRQVQTGGAKVVIFDFALDRRTTPPSDAALWRTMANGRRSVLGMGYDQNRTGPWTADDVRSLRFLERFALADNVILRGAAAAITFEWPKFKPPVSDFTGSSRGVGVFLRETDPDGYVRHARLLYRTKVVTPPTAQPLPGNLPESNLDSFDVVVPGLALSGARQAFGVDKTDLVVQDEAIRVAGNLDPPVAIPIDLNARMVINYAGPDKSYERYSLADVAEGRISPLQFRGKTVLFGVTATGSPFTDNQFTPYGKMPRVEITANSIASILSRSYITRVHGNAYVLVLAALGALAGLLLVSRRPAIMLLVGIVLALVYGLVVWSALTFAQLLLPVVPALLFLILATLIAVVCSFLLRKRRPRGLHFE